VKRSILADGVMSQGNSENLFGSYTGTRSEIDEEAFWFGALDLSQKAGALLSRKGNRIRLELNGRIRRNIKTQIFKESKPLMRSD